MPKPPSLRTAPFAALRAFEAAARLGSFKLAAEELAVTPAAISHQISALEEYLGIQLFLRSNRLVELSKTGVLLAKEVKSSFAQLQNALIRASAYHQEELGEKILMVSAAPSIAAKWLVPRLSRFHARHPDIDLRLSSENQTHDLINDHKMDVVIRYGRGEYGEPEHLHIERLWEETYLFPVCSPQLAQTKATQIKSLKDLQRHSLLRLPSPPDRQTGAIGERWATWLHQIAEHEEIPRKEMAALLAHCAKGPFYSHEHLAIDMAKSGHGIALALDVLAIEDLLAQSLQRPLPHAVRDPYGHFLIYRSADQKKAKIRAFSEWIRAEAELSRQTLQQCRNV